MSKDNDTANLLLNLIGSTQQDVLKNNVTHTIKSCRLGWN